MDLANMLTELADEIERLNRLLGDPEVDYGFGRDGRVSFSDDPDDAYLARALGLDVMERDVYYSQWRPSALTLDRFIRGEGVSDG